MVRDADKVYIATDQDEAAEHYTLNWYIDLAKTEV